MMSKLLNKFCLKRESKSEKKNNSDKLFWLVKTEKQPK